MVDTITDLFIQMSPITNIHTQKYLHAHPTLQSLYWIIFHTAIPALNFPEETNDHAVAVVAEANG